MSKQLRVLCLVIAGVLAAANGARADTLTFLGGTISGDEISGDACGIGLSGPAFSPAFGGCHVFGFAGSTRLENGLTGNHFRIGNVFINGQLYAAPPIPPFSFGENLTMLFTFNNVPIATTQDRKGPEVLQPFTMQGTWNLIDVSTSTPVVFDLTGSGTMRVFHGPASVFPDLQYTFAFAAPEPTSVLLIGVGLVSLAAFKNRSRSRP